MTFSANFIKKWWLWLIIGFIVLMILGGNSSNDTNTNNNANTSNDTNNQATDDNENNLDSCNVVIDSYRLEESRDGKPVVIVKYKFTNNSSSPQCFYYTVKDAIFQNGVGLKVCHTANNYSDDNKTKELQQGVTLDVEIAYYLNDTTTPIDVELIEFFDYSNKKVTKTFNID